MQSRNYCFTFHNPTPDEISGLKTWDKPKYIIWGHELGTNKETPHLQGYVEFKTPTRIKTLKNFNPKIHWETRKGTAKQASDYCRKEKGIIWESGQMTQQGQRTDLDNVANAVLKGKSIKEIAITYPKEYIKYHNGIQKLINLNQDESPQFRKLNVIVHWGKAGTGKTRRAHEEKPDLYKLDKGNNLWFDGYDGQDTLLIDDFENDGHIKFTHLLNILDGYKLRLEIKNGFTYAKWTTVYITSNYHPKDWFPVQPRSLKALMRRITSIKHFVFKRKSNK